MPKQVPLVPEVVTKLLSNAVAFSASTLTLSPHLAASVAYRSLALALSWHCHEMHAD